MLTFIKEKKEDLIESIKNGEVQEYIKDYILEMVEDEKLSEETICEYFDCEYREEDYDISYEALQNQCDNREDVKILRETILAVYKRVVKEIGEAK